MAAVADYAELLRVLMSKPEQERYTPEEDKILFRLHAKALGATAIASLIGGTLTWAATRRLQTFLPFNVSVARRGLQIVLPLYLSVGAAAVAGSGTLARSITPIVDHILGLDGTRMQKELANIIIRNNQGEAWRWKLMSKHFYLESVYDDASDKPQIRWRSRNTFMESISSSQTTHDSDSLSDNKDSPNIPTKIQHRGSDVTRAKSISQHGSGISGGDVVEDPLDCVFGDTDTTESIYSPASSTASSKVPTRKHKRAYRRRRMRNHEGLETSLYEHA